MSSTDVKTLPTPVGDEPQMIDVVIPAFNEENHISECLDQIDAQDYPRDRIRIFVTDAGSADRTADKVAARQEHDDRITLVTGRGRLNAGQALNASIELGNSSIIARVDAHTYIESDYLSQAVRILGELEQDVGLVGGQPKQVGDTKFGEAVAAARGSKFGVGNSVYSDRRERAFVETVQGGVYRREALAAVGGFATNMLVSEDEESAYRLTQAGYKVLLDTSLRFRYTTRSSWKAVFRQHMNYGRSRVRVVQAHPGSMRARYAVPAVFVSTLVGSITMSARSRAARAVLLTVAGTYSAAATVSAVQATDGDLRAAGRVAGCYSAQHLGYGLGLFRGIGTAAVSALGVADSQHAVTKR